MMGHAKMDLPDKLVSAIKALGEKYAVERIVLFGSRARGDNRLNSDIDLAVYPAPGFAKRGSFLSEIDDLETLLKIDVVFIEQSVDCHLLEQVTKEGAVIYEQL